ncbi:MAG: FAD-binding oxidoreductase [Pseudomonadota bacterium]
MTAVLISKHYPRDEQLSGWFHCLPTAKELPRLEQTVNADVVIVGAGFAGLSAAKRLFDNDPNLTVVVLEAQGLAWAGCGRNSGFMIDLPHELNSHNYSSEQSHDLAQIEENRLAIDFADELVNQFEIGSAFERVGKYHGATNGAGLKALQEYSLHLTALNEPFTELSASDLQRVTGSQYYDGGIYTPNAALIQPAAYIQGLGQALHNQSNITVFEHSPVVSIAPHTDGVTVATEFGKVQASKAILANNGFIESFGIAKGRLLHLFTYASMTEELDDKQLAQLGEPSSWGLIPAAPMGTTLRKLSSRRFLVRNQWTYNPDIESSNSQMQRYAKQHDACFLRRYPSLADVKMEHRWSGPIAMTMNGVPVFGEVTDNVFAAACCLGLGTTKSTLYGMMMADKLTGNSSDIMTRLENSAPPAYLTPRFLNQIGVPAYLKWTHWRAGNDL